MRYLTLFGSSWTVSIEAKALFSIGIHAGPAILDIEISGTLPRLPGTEFPQVTVGGSFAA
jgi:hypothetical protein